MPSTDTPCPEAIINRDLEIEPDKAEPENSAPPADKLELIAYLVARCTRCPLHKTRNRAVPGIGPENARIMFIAEGPGENEDQQGEPFVGAAGKFLDELLESAGLSRDEIYITNMIKCRTPDNRDPKPEEIRACNTHLTGQINAVDPELIVTLGRFSLQRFIPGARIGEVQGAIRRIGGRNILPIMHPAAGLRRSAYRYTIQQHFNNILLLLEQARINPPLDEPMPGAAQAQAPKAGAGKKPRKTAPLQQTQLFLQ